LAALCSSKPQECEETETVVGVDTDLLRDGLLPVFSQYDLKMDRGLEVADRSLQTLGCSVLERCSLPQEEREERELYEHTECSSDEDEECSDSSFSISIDNSRLENGSESISGTEALPCEACCWCELLGKAIFQRKILRTKIK
jgi:hypothetical protein